MMAANQGAGGGGGSSGHGVNVSLNRSDVRQNASGCMHLRQVGRGGATHVTRPRPDFSYISRLVKRPWWLLLGGLAACGPDPGIRRGGVAKQRAVDTTLASRLRGGEPRPRPRDRALTTPRVITEPTVVVFWLRATDSLSRDSAEAASRDLDYYTEQVALRLSANAIALVPTNVDTVFVEQPGHGRRAIVLSGLDYPYGYLLVDPGTPERILTGIYDDEQLLDELGAYFDLSDESDSTRAIPRAVT